MARVHCNGWCISIGRCVWQEYGMMQTQVHGFVYNSGLNMFTFGRSLTNPNTRRINHVQVQDILAAKSLLNAPVGSPIGSPTTTPNLISLYMFVTWSAQPVVDSGLPSDLSPGSAFSCVLKMLNISSCLTYQPTAGSHVRDDSIDRLSHDLKESPNLTYHDA